MNCSFYGKTMQNVKSRFEVKSIRKDDDDKLVKLQSKRRFNGIQEFYDKYETYTFEHTEILMD